MGQEAFYRENKRERQEEELFLTERFGEEGRFWKIRPLSQKENEEIWKRCQKETGRYEGAVLTESICFPDLKDAALQNSYGVAGEERLLERLLLPGEYDRLRQAVEAINGGEAEECIAFI